MDALALKLPFDEKEFITANAEYISEQVQIPNVIAQAADEEQSQRCTPGKPLVTFE
jgi:hypothetical protein